MNNHYEIGLLSIWHKILASHPMKLPKAFTGRKDHINVIIETPRGSNSKYAFDPDTQLFKLSKAFPTGMFFPVIEDIIQFFINYHNRSGDKFKPLATRS